MHYFLQPARWPNIASDRKDAVRWNCEGATEVQSLSAQNVCEWFYRVLYGLIPFRAVNNNKDASISPDKRAA